MFNVLLGLQSSDKYNIIQPPTRDYMDTCLCLCASKGLVDYDTILLNEGANPLYCDDKGFTSLMRASENCHIDILI